MSLPSIEELKGKKEKAIKNQDFEGAANMRDKEKQAKDKQAGFKVKWTLNYVSSSVAPWTAVDQTA